MFTILQHLSPVLNETRPERVLGRQREPNDLNRQRCPLSVSE
jgi:hypothetical protein